MIQLRLHHAEPSLESRTSIPCSIPDADAAAVDAGATNAACASVVYASEVGTMVYNNDLYSARTYSFYYPENLALGCWGACVNPRSQAWGYHRHDLEAVTVLFTQGGLPRHVFFFAHADRQGMWVPWAECERTADGALVVYVARGSHASYPRPGRYWRVLGFANDVCSSRGAMVRPVVRPAQDRDLEGGGGFSLRAQLRVPPPTSITPWQRFILPFCAELR